MWNMVLKEMKGFSMNKGSKEVRLPKMGRERGNSGLHQLDREKESV